MTTRQSPRVAARERRVLRGVAVGLSLIAAGSVRAAVICVPTAFDGSCTAFAPTIQLAIDLANPAGGDTVFVAPGMYAETVTLGHGGVVPGSAGIDINKSLTLKSSMGAGATTITNGSSTPGGHCLPTSCPGGPVSLVTLSSSGITIDGFKILDTDPPINLITADGDAVSDNHTIKNNHITNPTFDDGNSGGGWGILLGGTGIDGADNNTITGNEFDLNPDLTKNQFTFGIGLSGGGADSNDNNVISGNSLHDMGFGGFGDKNDTNTTVSGNTFMDLAKVGWQDFGSASGEMILGNTFHNAGRAGLEIRNGAQSVTVQNNCFSLNGSSPPTFSPCPAGGCVVTPFGGIRLEDDGASPGTMGTTIHNNNFAGNNAPHGVTDNTAASNATDGEAENNWWGCATGPGNTGCDSVTSNVDFTPFLTFPAAGTPCTPPSADLSVSKADSPDPVHRGQQLTYTIMVHNAGPDSAMGVTLTDTLPKATGFGSVATTQGTCTRTPKNTVQCSLGNLTNGETVTVTIVVKPTQKKPGMITNTVSVTATSPGDPNTANNSASASTMVVP